MKKKKKENKPDLVSIKPLIQTTSKGQLTLLQLTLNKTTLTVTEEQAVDLGFQLSSMLPNSLKAQLAGQLINALGATFR